MRSSDVSCLNEALSSKTNPTFSVVVPVYNASTRFSPKDERTSRSFLSTMGRRIRVGRFATLMPPSIHRW